MEKRTLDMQSCRQRGTGKQETVFLSPTHAPSGFLLSPDTHVHAHMNVIDTRRCTERLEIRKASAAAVAASGKSEKDRTRLHRFTNIQIMGEFISPHQVNMHDQREQMISQDLILALFLLCREQRVPPRESICNVVE